MSKPVDFKTFRALLEQKKIMKIEKTGDSNGIAIHAIDGTCFKLWFTSGECYINEMTIDYNTPEN